MANHHFSAAPHGATTALQFQSGLLRLAEALASRAGPWDIPAATVQAMSSAAQELDYLAGQATGAAHPSDLTP